MNFTFNIPIFLTVFGGMVLAISALFDRNTGKRIRVINFIGSLIIIVAGVFTSHSQAEFEDLLKEQTKKVSNVLTGGDSFAYVSVTIAKDSSADHLEFNVLNEGDYPVRDLSIEITDLDYLNKLYYEAILNNIPLTLQYFEKSKIRKVIGTIGPHKIVQAVATATMPSSFKDRNFSIIFDSLYQHYYQPIHIGRNKDRKLVIDSQIKSGDKTLYSLGDTNHFEAKMRPEKKEKEKSKMGWSLSQQGESITVKAIDGKWAAFDAKGRIVEPQQINK